MKNNIKTILLTIVVLLAVLGTIYFAWVLPSKPSREEVSYEPVVTPFLENNPARPHELFGTDSGTVIYGEDNRLDYCSIKDLKVKECSDAVASSWFDYEIKDNNDGTSTLNTRVFGKAYRLAQDESFYNQPIGAHCTAFLVAPDIMVTAGHCLKPRDFKNIRFVFGFAKKRQTKKQCVISDIVENENIYKVDEIISYVLRTADLMDYAVVRLDRPVKNIKPLKLSTKEVKTGDWLFVIGHPCGLPLKYAPGARVLSNWNSVYFKASLDTYGGNSGSPVFNSNYEVVGILVRGETDFISTSEGRRSNIGVSGEGVTRVKNWKRFVK